MNIKTLILLILASIAFNSARSETIIVSKNSTNELDIIMATLWDECRGESMNAKRAIASVMHWRKEHNWNKKTTWKGILTSGEFSGWRRTGSITIQINNSIDRKAYNACKSIATELVNGTFTRTIEASHFEGVKFGDPPWINKVTFVQRVGNSNFYMKKAVSGSNSK